MTKKEKLKELFKTELKFLFFQDVKPNLKEMGNYYLIFALLTTWLAGVGRYWDNPRADLWQYLGLGSVIYIFVLALLLWAIIKPLKPENWSYKNVLIFVGMTSPTGILYAIPVERYFSLSTSQTMNVWFLAVVATWRVILLFLYLKRVAKLSGLAIVVATLLPIVITITGLTMLNLEHVVFKLMAGLAEHERSANDAAYSILILLTTLSVMLSPVLMIAYLVIGYQKAKTADKTEHSL
ncbi:hypothetical protein [Sulfurovum sp.]|uniref:hypothetical protein n=1 Tax=Sulfurovum sp. TaxID=1969726 RepID=UPI00356544ED